MSSETGRAPAEHELSAGGLVVREGEGGPEVVVIVPTRRGARGQRVLALPKGHPDAGESLEQAAAREVREEAGVIGTLVGELGDVRYWYSRDGRRIAKRVAFYLYDYASGDVAEHDHEVEEARWMPLSEAVRELTHAGERDMATRAQSWLAADR